MSIFGILATIASLTIVLGLLAQIVKNYQWKSCEGLSTHLVYSACISYTLWALYGWTKPDWHLVVSQTPGCILAFVLLFQLFSYKRRQTNENA